MIRVIARVFKSEILGDHEDTISMDALIADDSNSNGIEHLSNRNYDYAIRDFDQAIQRYPKNPQFYLNRGLARYATGEYDRAIRDYDVATKLDETYTMATAVKMAPSAHYSVLWLHLAPMRAGLRELHELTKSAQTLDHAKWPWPVVSLFLGASSPEAVRAAAEKADNPDTHREQACEADFYLASYQQERGARDGAQQLLESAKETCPRAFLEYSAANHELQRLR